MTSPHDIIKRLEAAKGADRELDALLHQATHPDLADALPTDSGWLVGGDHSTPTRCPAYTASIDAAIVLVERMLPGAYKWICEGRNQHGAIEWTAALFRPEHLRVSGEAPTAALALLIALFKAKAEK